jgi:hypothetical protein
MSNRKFHGATDEKQFHHTIPCLSSIAGRVGLSSLRHGLSQQLPAPQDIQERKIPAHFYNDGRFHGCLRFKTHLRFGQQTHGLICSLVVLQKVLE